MPKPKKNKSRRKPMSKDSNKPFRCPACVCGDLQCKKLREIFHCQGRNDVLLRANCQVVSFANKKKGNGNQESLGQKKTEKKKEIYQECFGKELKYNFQYHVAFLHFPLPHLEYCLQLRKQRQESDTKTRPAAPVAGSEMKTARLGEFKVDKYEAKDWSGNLIYFIPPNVSLKEVDYGLKTEEMLKRVQPPQVEAKGVHHGTKAGKASEKAHPPQLPMEVQCGLHAEETQETDQGDPIDDELSLMNGSVGTLPIPNDIGNRYIDRYDDTFQSDDTAGRNLKQKRSNPREAKAPSDEELQDVVEPDAKRPARSTTGIFSRFTSPAATSAIHTGRPRDLMDDAKRPAAGILARVASPAASLLDWCNLMLSSKNQKCRQQSSPLLSRSHMMISSRNQKWRQQSSPLLRRSHMMISSENQKWRQQSSPLLSRNHMMRKQSSSFLDRSHRSKALAKRIGGKRQSKLEGCH